MKKLLDLALLVLLGAIGVSAQGYHVHLWPAQTPTGQAVAGATITVCTSPATETPCTNTTSIYSDAALTRPKTNPFQADGYGQFDWYASPGTYVYSISGTGVAATNYRVTAPCVPGSACDGMTATTSKIGNKSLRSEATTARSVVFPDAAGNIVLDSATQTLAHKTLSGVTLSSTPASSDAPLNPASSDAVLYVTGPNGSDSNDGKSWGRGMATMAHALSSLPSAGGDVFVGGALTSWAGGTLPAHVRIRFTGANQTVTIRAPIVASIGDEIDCAPGVNLTTNPPRGGTVLSASGLRSSQDGIDIPGNANAVTIRGCYVDMGGVGRYGIYISGSSNDRLSQVTVQDPVDDGIRVDSGTSPGYHSYDEVFEQVLVIHSSSGIGFDFRTDGGGGDMDRVTCIECKYHSVDPRSRTESGMSSFAFVTGTRNNNGIADFSCIDCHAGGAGETGSEVLVALTQSGSSFIHNWSYTGLIEHNFGAKSGTGLGITDTSAAGVTNLYLRSGFAHLSTSTNIAQSNVTGYVDCINGWSCTMDQIRLGDHSGKNGGTILPPGAIAHIYTAYDWTFPSHTGTLALSGANGVSAGTIAISSATRASHTFGTVYSSTPDCIVTPESDPGRTTWWVTKTARAVTVNLSVSGTITFDFVCTPAAN